MKNKTRSAAKPSGASAVRDAEKTIALLPELIKQDKFGVVNIQRALNCDVLTAMKIYRVLLTDGDTMSVEKNFFELNEKDKILYLKRLINDRFAAGKCMTEEVSERAERELISIEHGNMADTFLFAHSVAGILREMTDKPRFVGIGCCSVVAYLIGITGEAPDPIGRGLIFERGFGENVCPETPFSFYVPENELAMLEKKVQKSFADARLERQGDELILSAAGAHVGILDSALSLYRVCDNAERSVYSSGHAVFQEDYMHLFHCIGGYSYEEANKIRRAIGMRKYDEIEEYRIGFMRGAAAILPPAESGRLFTEIAAELGGAYCKAYVLSAKAVLDAHFPSHCTAPPLS